MSKPSVADLPVYLPEKPSIDIEVVGGGRVQINREPQRGILVVPMERLLKALGLPEDHRVERVSIAADPYEPGITLVVEGPAMFFAQVLTPLHYESIERFEAEVEKRREGARQHWLDEALRRKAAEQ